MGTNVLLWIQPLCQQQPLLGTHATTAVMAVIPVREESVSSSQEDMPAHAQQHTRVLKAAGTIILATRVS